MTKRKMNIIVKQEDVRQIVIKCVQLCIDAFNKKHNQSIHNLSKSLDNGTPHEIQDSLNSVLNNCSELGQDFSDAMVAVAHLIPSPTDAEVLEDLSDLEEDGLGVNSGSKEPVGFSSDHSEE